MAKYWFRDGHEDTGPDPIWTAKGPGLSLAFFCPHCGEIWARRQVAGSRWIAYHDPCDRCPPWGGTPGGSIWGLLTFDDKQALPASVVRRELHIHLDYYEGKRE